MKEIRIKDIKKILVETHNLSHDDVLQVDDFGDDDLLFDYEGTGAESLEFDSLDALEVAAYLEDEYDIALPSEIDPVRISTPRRIAEFVSELIQSTKAP